MNLKNLIVSLRNIKNNALFSVINIVGLSLGTAIVILILLWVADELSYDKSHKNIDRIFTVYEHQVYSNDQDLFTPCTPYPLSGYLADNYPEVEKATTFNYIGNQLFTCDEKEYTNFHFFCVDTSFLSVFTYNILEGDPKALNYPDNIIIDEEVAKTLFGDETALHKTIKLYDEYEYTVAAVMEKQGNSTLNFQVLLPQAFMQNVWGVGMSSWGNNWPRTSVLLKDEKLAETFGSKITGLCKDKGQDATSLYVFPFKKEHLNSYSGRNNRIQYIYQFIAIALIIILIASINFINLSTVKAEQKSSGIGIRKVLGAARLNILKQYALENGLLVFVSLLFSLVLIFLLLPAFNSVADKEITINLVQNRIFMLMVVVSIVSVFGISVLYPSFYLSSFNPALILRKTGGSGGRFSLRNLLIVVQFILSIILISGSIVVPKQIKYINNYDLGYNKHNLVYLRLQGEAVEKHHALGQEFRKIAGIENLTMTDNIPFFGSSSSWGYDWEGKNADTRVLISNFRADRNYFATLGIEFENGKTFSKMYEEVVPSNEISKPEVVLNQEAIRRMQMEQPVGKFFDSYNNKKGIITGVIRDFNFQSLRNTVEPLVITPLYGDPTTIIIRVNPAGFSETLEQIKSSWGELLPDSNCEISFFDEQLEDMYNSEQRVSALFKYFACIAIFISCIGLFGFSLFIIERKTKEIGVRKVNGANIIEVLGLINQYFIRLIIVAFIITMPIAYFAMNRWLENFAYKMELNWWIFISAGAIVLGVALLTVTFQSWRAARRNPVEALRYE